MKAPCGQENCDCGHTIEVMVKALEGLMPWMGKALADDAFARCSKPKLAKEATAHAHAVIKEAKS